MKIRRIALLALVPPFLSSSAPGRRIPAPPAAPHSFCMPRACSTWKAAGSSAPGEVLVEGERITAAGRTVSIRRAPK